MDAQRNDKLVLALSILVGGGIAQWLLRIPYYVGAYNDDACYLLRAFSLVGGGKCMICELTLTQGRDFAPGWPFLLTPVALVAREALWVYRGLALILTMGSALTLGLLARRYFDSRTGLVVALSFLISAAGLRSATSTMAEPLFVFLICLLLGWKPSSNNWKAYCLFGTVVGLCMITRTEGMAVLLAATLSLVLRQKWREAAATLTTSLSLWAVVTYFRPTDNPHKVQSLDFFEDGEAALSYLLAWTSKQLPSLGRSYFGEPDAWGVWLAGGLTLLSAVGCYRWWKQEPGIGPWWGLAMPAALLFWPYINSRYWYSLLPVWLLGIAFALPKKVRTPGLACIMALQIWGVLAIQRPDQSPVVELYRSARQSPAQERVTSLHDCRLHLYSHRATVAPKHARSAAELLVFMAAEKSGLVVWENDFGLLPNVHGGYVGEFMDNLPLWLERCPLYEVIVTNTAGVACRLRTPPEQIIAAFALYQQAFGATDVRARLQLLQKCLDAVPDFPGAKMAWAQAAFEVSEIDRLLVAKAIEEHLERYPHDFPNTAWALQALSTLGQPEQAEATARRALDEARTLNRPNDVKALESILSSQGTDLRPQGGPPRGDERPAP